MYIVLESILFVLTEGCSWRAIDRPQARWNSVYQYFRRWCQRGVLKNVLTQFGPELAAGWHFVDSTHVKVHADGSNPAGGQALQAMGRTKGGLNTKIHALVQRDLASCRYCLVRWEPSRHLFGRRAHRVPARRFNPHRRLSL